MLPWLSAAEQTTCVSPIGKFDPESGEQEADPAPSTISEVAGLAYGTAVPAALAVVTVISAWAAMVGTVVSSTVTRNAAIVVWPLRSLALQFTVVVPSANVELESGEHVTGREPSTTSKAEAE